MERPFVVDEAEFGFSTVTREKLWEVEELYAGNIAMLKQFVSQLSSFGLVEHVSPDLLTILDDISYTSPTIAPGGVESAHEDLAAAHEDVEAPPAPVDEEVQETANVSQLHPIDVGNDDVVEDASTQELQPEGRKKAPRRKAKVEESQRPPRPARKRQGGVKNKAAANEEQQGPEDDSPAVAQTPTVDAEPVDENPEAVQEVNASQAGDAPAEDETASQRKKGGRKVQLRKGASSKAATAARARGNKDAERPAPAGEEPPAASSQEETGVIEASSLEEGSLTPEADAALASELHAPIELETAEEAIALATVPQLDALEASGQSTSVLATAGQLELPRDSASSARDYPDVQTGTSAEQPIQDSHEPEALPTASSSGSKRALDAKNAVVKKPRHDLFPSEPKQSTMKFPRLAETLSSVDFAIRPSIAKDADAQDISVADTSKSPRADIDIVGRAESEALRQDERLQTIIKSSVDKLKGDLSRLKKPASGTSHGSASTSSSQGPERSLPIPARSKESDPKPAAEGANTVSPPHGDVAPSSAGQGKASSEHVASQFGTDSVLPAKTLLAVPGSGMSETYTAPEVVQGSSALRASPKLLPLATAHDDLVPKDKEEAEAEKPSPAKEATHEIEEGEQERLSMSFFAGVAQADNISGTTTFVPTDLGKDASSQKARQLEIKALSAAASAREKEEMDRERRIKLKEQVEERRKEAILKKQQEEAKRAEELRRKEEEWKKKAEAAVVRPPVAADKPKDAAEKPKVVESERPKIPPKEVPPTQKSNIPTLNKRPETLLAAKAPLPPSQEKALPPPKRPRSPELAEPHRKVARIEEPAVDQQIGPTAAPAKPASQPKDDAPRSAGQLAGAKSAAASAPLPKAPSDSASKPPTAPAAPVPYKPIANPILSPGLLQPAQQQAAKGQPSPQSITDLYGGEIPDIPSDESDDDDDHRENKAPVPGWAQTPNLHFSLVTQSQLNPEKVFGKVQPLALEDVFQNPARAHKYHKRTSSGNWGGADRLTQEEEEEYSRMMGFQ